MNLSKTSIIENYKNKCGNFSVYIKQQDNINIIYIETERFKAHTLYTKETAFQNFPEEIQNLYKVTFADAIVMEKYERGVPKTIQEFETIVKERSLCALHNYPFTAFIVMDKTSDLVVGYEEIDKGPKDCTGEIAYLFNKAYHNGPEKKYKYVGYENVGALTWGYCAQLYTNRALINQTYNPEKQQFEGGSTFKTLLATARTDNPASSRILSNLGFKK